MFQALGDVDELNSVIGVARQFIEIPPETQNDIATLVSLICTLFCKNYRARVAALLVQRVRWPYAQYII